MRLKDAIASLQLGRKKEAEIRQLCTVWSEKADSSQDLCLMQGQIFHPTG